MKRTTSVVILAATALSVGCASKGFVREEIGTVNQRVDEVENQVEANQTEIAENDQEIAQNEEDLRAAEAELARQEEALANASQTAREAYDRALAAGELAEGKFLYEVALTDDKVRFGFDQAELSDEARAALDEFAAKLKEENRDVYVEVQGHTDTIGSEDYNFDLGLARAEAVRRYLNLRGLPLHRLAVISYGETEPVVDERTPADRAQNRRVLLVVLQ